MITLRQLIALIALAALAQTSQGALRCGSSLVNDDAWPIEVEESCGPASERVEWQTLQPVLIQGWLYDFSSNQFRQLVTLRNGQVVDITSRAGK